MRLNNQIIKTSLLSNENDMKINMQSIENFAKAFNKQKVFSK